MRDYIAPRAEASNYAENLKRNKRGAQLIVLEVLVYLHTNKRAHARVVSNLLILSCV